MRALLVLTLLLYAHLCAADGAYFLVDDTSREAFSRPFTDLTDAQREQFFRGRALFHQSWVIAPAQDANVDGLGPLYNRLACISCHPKNARGAAPEGPEQRMQSMLVRLSIPGTDINGGPRPDPHYGDQLNEEGIPGVPGEGRALLTWENTAARLGDGTPVQLRRPRIAFADLAYGALAPGLMLSPRVGQQVIGMGLLQAVPAAELQRLADTPKPDGVLGKVNRVWDPLTRRMAAGRFGYKANVATLRAQVAGAMHGDLGITSTAFPAQNCTAAQRACRAAPEGGHPELSDAQLDDIAFYLAHVAVPAPRHQNTPEVQRGRALFTAAGCALCHVDTLTTGTQARCADLANLTIHPYTDLLVHDMGEGLADGRPDFAANGREWRTPPLWGIGLTPALTDRAGYLHDGRARSLLEAVLWHGGEAQHARDRFAALPAADRDALLAFVAAL